MVGGHNVVVEVDETFITSRHGRRGRWVRRHPFCTERGSGISFMIPVPDRKAATLLQLIGQHVRPATTLSSDMWRSYGGIRAMPQRFQHWATIPTISLTQQIHKYTLKT